MPIALPKIPASSEFVLTEPLCFDYPGSDIILRSCDFQDCRVPKLYIANSSPVLRELIQTISITPGEDNGDEEALPVVKLPESGTILYSLLTFIFPVAPVLPSTTENIVRLLAVAQKYRMDSVLTYVRGVISIQDPPFILPETALNVYFLAQKYGLLQEMLRAARTTLRLSMTIEDLAADDKINFMPGTYLRELWKYHERVRKDLVSSLLEFRKSGAPGILKNLRCGTPPQTVPPSTTSTPTIPQWLDDYIESLAQAPHLFDLIEFEHALSRHIKNQPQHSAPCPCVGISRHVIRAFWEALTKVVQETIEKADSTLILVKEVQPSECPIPPFVPSCSNVSDANIILRSSDQVNFRVRQSVLAMSSPFFEDLLSLPQPPDGEIVDGLPVVQLSEDASLLGILVSQLYPISSVPPSSYEEVFALLAACQKYDMTSIQSHVRSEIKLGTFPAPFEAESFTAYAIASKTGLIPEMENAARLTLGYPMTFESLGEALRSFEGRALCDLVSYRKRCRDSLVSCVDSYFSVRSRCQIWVGCREPFPQNGVPVNSRDPPTGWLNRFFSGQSVELKNCFTHAISSPAAILEEYRTALKNHHSMNCTSCFRAHAMEGETFCRELEDQLTQALNKVSVSCSKDTPRRNLKSRKKAKVDEIWI